MNKTEYLMSLSMFLLIIGLHFSSVICSIISVVGLTIGLLFLRKDLRRIENVCLQNKVHDIKGNKSK